MIMSLLPNWLINGSPVVFVSEIFIVLALLALLGALALGSKSAVPDGWHGKTARDRWIASERRVATQMGMEFKKWIGLRIVFFVVSVLVGLISGLPLLMVTGFVLGLFGLRWVMAPSLSKRQMRIERLFLSEIKTLRAMNAEQGISLDKAIREVAKNCDRELREIMAPLLEDVRLDDRLVKVAERADSPLVSQICGALIVARSHDPSVLASILGDNLIPLGEGRQEVSGKAQALLTTQHSYIRALTVLLVVFLLMSQRVPSFHDFYSSLIGQMVLIADLAVFAGLLFLMGKFLAVPKGYEVNVAEVSERMGAHIV